MQLEELMKQGCYVLNTLYCKLINIRITFSGSQRKEPGTGWQDSYHQADEDWLMEKKYSIMARAQQEFVSIALLPVYFELFDLRVKFPFIQQKFAVAIYYKNVSQFFCFSRMLYLQNRCFHQYAKQIFCLNFLLDRMMINNIEMNALSRPWSADGIKLLNNQLIIMSVQGDSLRSEVRKDVPLDGVPSTSRIPREQKRETISSMQGVTVFLLSCNLQMTKTYITR